MHLCFYSRNCALMSSFIFQQFCCLLQELQCLLRSRLQFGGTIWYVIVKHTLVGQSTTKISRGDVGRIQDLSNYSSMEGVLYCKPHFEQLYKESGNFNKNFLSPAKSADQMTPVLTKSPSKAAGMFSGTQDKCATCGKTAYPLEKIMISENLPCLYSGT
ncbi:hypothetical protein POM88_027717 [Heracleum sosnowskyi]|uniref:Uncharacterized protein n=1 Tax=Heracleum sosnowskyi TaxID=360622 RepID=A0AAD8MR97_9APIA|nr:hypothetical protein POM88_027717 [Heracleum sosnowskyi]